MAAGQGFKTFTTGEVLTAADVNGYLMQGVLVFASEAARDAAITSPQEGQFAYTKDNNSLWYYTGSAWAASGATGDIEGVTAGVGISGGGTSGTVTITNSMATAIDAKGDLVAGTGADAFSRLAVGANDTVLTADSTAATGLKWASPAASGWTQLVASTSLGTGASVTISSISQAYKDLRLIITGWSAVNSGGVQISFNNTTDQYYGGFYTNYTTTWTVSRTNSGRTYFRMGDDLYLSSTGDYVVDLPFYSTTNNKKLGQAYGTGLDGGSGADGGFWCNFMKANNSAISSLILSSSGGNFDAGSYELWGLK